MIEHKNRGRAYVMLDQSVLASNIIVYVILMKSETVDFTIRLQPT